MIITFIIFCFLLLVNSVSARGRKMEDLNFLFTIFFFRKRVDILNFLTYFFGIFWIFYDSLGFWIILEIFWIIYKVTKVTTKCYGD